VQGRGGGEGVRRTPGELGEFLKHGKKKKKKDALFFLAWNLRGSSGGEKGKRRVNGSLLDSQERRMGEGGKEGSPNLP